MNVCRISLFVHRLAHSKNFEGHTIFLLWYTPEKSRILDVLKNKLGFGLLHKQSVGITQVLISRPLPALAISIFSLKKKKKKAYTTFLI
jgi:hypothetical protein